MFLTRSEYDRGVNTFSPEGRLFQVEYAIEAVKLGTTSIGIKTREGVALAAEKRVQSKLIVPESVEKISVIDEHIACAWSGLIADSRTMIDYAQRASRDYWFTYNRMMKVEDVTQMLANRALAFSDPDAETRMSRPFGVAMMLAGADKDGPQLFHLDPSGTYIDCLAKAVGGAADGAEQTLKETYHENMSLAEAQKTAVSILKQVMEEKLNNTNVEVATVVPVDTSTFGKFHRLSTAELDEIIATL